MCVLGNKKKIIIDNEVYLPNNNIKYYRTAVLNLWSAILVSGVRGTNLRVKT